MNQTKMMKTSGVIDKLFNLVQIIMAIGGAVVIIAIIVMLVFGDRILQAADVSLSLGELSLSLKDLSQVVDISALKISMIFDLAAVVVLLAFGWYVIRLFRRLLGPMKEGRPFDNGASNVIRRLAWAVLIGGAVNELIGMIAVFVETKAIYFTVLFHTEAVTGHTIDHVIDVGFVLTALVLFLLSYIFRYGEELQKESDETL